MKSKDFIGINFQKIWKILSYVQTIKKDVDEEKRRKQKANSDSINSRSQLKRRMHRRYFYCLQRMQFSAKCCALEGT